MKNLSVCILFILALSAAVSCGSKKEAEVPSGIIPADSLPVILSDVYIAEAGLAYCSRMGDTMNNRKIGPYYSAIFKKYRISSARFDSSISWYALHPALLLNVYQDALDILTRKQSETMRGKP